MGLTFREASASEMALARTLVAQPKVLILDEFTSSMDAETEGMILETIKALQSDVITILVSHQAFIMKYADDVFEIRGGTLTTTLSSAQHQKRN